MSSSSSFPVPLGFYTFFFFFLTIFLFTTQATVPPSKTFKFINEGEFGDYIVEYEANYRVSDIQTFPFALCFYNTTPNAFTLGLRMGSHRSESIMRWFWDANRANPVRENATLSFGTNGNLILIDSDGSVAWQTGTANKGVVGLSLLSNGNLVLYNQKGRFVWQSFDHPTDTLLVGQSLRPGGPTKLVSRISAVDGSEGSYSFEIVQKWYWAMYMKSKNSVKPLLYYVNEFHNGDTLSGLLFNSAPETNEGYAFELKLEIERNNVSAGSLILARPKYNSTLSMLRVEYDGNLKIYTYYDKVDYGAWQISFNLFDRNGRESECKLPSRCGSLGVCEDDQCVACPTPKGLFGWSKTCTSPVLPPCNKGAIGGKAKVDYYKVVGVDHFLNGYTEGDGPMKVSECRDKCSKDCGCLGFFYREESSKCLLAPELGTLTKVSNITHVAFIKYSK
ncbi:hypothetical protein NE237_000396 [Protea cynaroides]|uniref:Bulb-type lectin domain-containing protein n=1 Tax=Protea cynaroides TaxID=273540 RepID=A0A9Q0KRE6_9MAGN|nr:hypothetical protein NE237_000396 [Protea cynaroides]